MPVNKILEIDVTFEFINVNNSIVTPPWSSNKQKTIRYLPAHIQEDTGTKKVTDNLRNFLESQESFDLNIFSIFKIIIINQSQNVGH